MLANPSQLTKNQFGITLIEVLVTIVILAFGLLGLAALQGKTQLAGLESFQRVQAALLASDMAERINANRANAANYVVAGFLGTGDTQPANCTTLTDPVAIDQCQWSNALKGVNETAVKKASGGVIGGRGCIVQLRAPDPTSGVCLPGIYQVTVAWQGTHQTLEPADSCAKGQYGALGFRHTISVQVSIGLPSC